MDPYTQSGEKDILWEIMRMEEEHGTVYPDAELQPIYDAAAVPGQIDSVAESISTGGKYTSDASTSSCKSWLVMGTR